MDDAQGTPPEPEREVPVATGPPVSPEQPSRSSIPPHEERLETPIASNVPPWVGMPKQDEPEPPKEKQGSFLKELPILIIIAFGLALIIKTFLLQAFYIPSESMTPTLQVGDRVLVNKLVYRIHPPRRGDIIVFIEQPAPHKSFWGRVRSFLTEGLGVTKPLSQDFIKRVIALPGETIKITDGVVTITTPDGKRSFTLDEPYLHPDTSSFGPEKVPAGDYFVMGDNRGNSADSRTLLYPGVPKSRIIGRAFIRIWPIGRVGFFHRPRYPSTTAAGLMSMAPALVMGSALVLRRRRAA
ncbi:MAG TPA: signal peptidase I [Actinomycetota bacterium]|nr:signal peptidase I [Actinomycetota bacterium]